MQAIRKYKSIIEGAVLLGIAVILAIAVSSGINSYLANPKHPIVSVTTGSMLPIYNGFQDYEYSEMYPFRGDILLIRKVPIEDIQVGDVIIFDTPQVDDPVVHRVVAKWQVNGTYFFKTNGDNRVDPDSWEIVGEENIIHGVVVFRIPHVGWFLLVIQTTLGRLIILSLAIILLFIGGEEDEHSTDDKQLIRFSDLKGNSKSTKAQILQKMLSLERTISSKQPLFYFTIITLIIVSFLGVNIAGAIISPPDVNIYAMSDRNLTTPLEDTVIPVNLTSNYGWREDSYYVSFIPVRIEITSGGLFNNIDHFEIRVNETVGLYRWTITYNFIGTKVIEGAIIAHLNDPGFYSATIGLHIFSRGILASSTRTLEFDVFLIET